MGKSYLMSNNQSPILKNIVASVLSLFILNGCEIVTIPLGVASLVEYSRTSENYQDVLYFSGTYSLTGVHTYDFILSCEDTKFVRIKADFKKDYCDLLDVEIKKSIEKKFPEWRYEKDNPDILIQIVFEAAWGGLRPHKGNMARFISSRIHYVEPIFFIKIIRWETIVAEHRLKSYSRHSIPFFTDKTTNEQSFMKTTGDVAEEVVRFIEDPTTFKYVMKEDYIDNPGS